MTAPLDPSAPALSSVRLAGDTDGNVDVLVMGPGPFPLLAWRVPRVYIEELLAQGSAAIVQCDPETLGMSLHYPRGQMPGTAFQAMVDDGPWGKSEQAPADSEETTGARLNSGLPAALDPTD